MNPPASQTEAPLRLIDCCTLVCQRIFELDQLIAGGDVEAIRYACEDAFNAMANEAKRAGYRLEDIEAAKYALVALIDERILSTQSPVQEVWLGDPLQMRYFDEFAAGEEFYNRLDRLRADSDAKTAVLEVYHLVLVLGFAGKLADRRGQERRQVLIDGLGKDLADTLGAVSQEDERSLLAARDTVVSSQRALLDRIPLWSVPAAVFLLVCLVYGLLAWWREARLDQLVQTFAGS